MQNSVPLNDVVSPISESAGTPQQDEVQQDRPATIWVSRITGLVGAVCLLLALGEWAFRHGHYRTVLALLTVAMFAAILHSYTFEDGI